MTQQSSSQRDAAMGRYPLSFTQEYFCSLDDGDLKGAFGNRFTIVSAVLRGALDDMVGRHECQVPLETRVRPAGRARDLIAEDAIIEAEKSTLTSPTRASWSATWCTTSTSSASGR